MTRLDFPRKVRAAALKRAMGADEKIRCEDCGGVCKRVEFDHVLPDALGGKPTLENCKAICEVCHRKKTKDDIGRIRKADRQRDKDTGAFKKTSRPLPGSRASGIRKRLNGTVERWT